MGGIGSGRPPNVLNQLKPALVNPIAEELILPNFGGLKEGTKKTDPDVFIKTETDPIFLNLSGSFLTAETDPRFLALSGSLNYVVAESDPVFIATSGSFLQAESDPIFIATSGSFLQAESDPIFIATSGSFLQSETDPVWLSMSGSFLQAETDPRFLALSGSLAYVVTEVDPIFLALSGSLAYIPSISGSQLMTAYDHSQDNTQAHTDYMLNTGDTAAGTYNFDSNTLVVNSTTHRVGIGTTNPGSKLEVSEASQANAIWLSRGITSGQTSVPLMIGSDALTYYQLQYYANSVAASSRLDWEVNESPKLTLLGNGNVGIGTTAPGSKLTVGTLPGTGYTAGSAASFYAADSQNIITLDETGVANPYEMQIGTLRSAAATTIQSFHAGVGVANLLLNLNGGNVGIGTTNPSVKLDVNGTILGSTLIAGDGFTGTINAVSGSVVVNGIITGWV